MAENGHSNITESKPQFNKSGISRLVGYFSKFELALLLSSIMIVILTFLIFDGENYIAMAASLLGVTALIFCAKGNPIGQAMVIVFSLLYAYTSYTFAYYGEMITYLGMSAPMAVYALISWIKNPYGKDRSEVKINKLHPKELFLLIPLTVIVTIAFYFILKHFGTSNLLPSTFSVSTSFVAVYLTARRSPFYAIAYAFNDVVLIILWLFASLSDTSYVSVLVCFIIFLVNDAYAYFNWIRMEKRQRAEQSAE